MDIYSAEKHMEKLLAYVKGVADAKPTLYEKSRGRWKGLASSCQKLISYISRIIEDDILQEDSDEFGRQIDHNLASCINSMRTELDRLSQFVNYSPTDQLITTVDSEWDESSSNITITARKAMMYTYSIHLHHLATMSTGNYIVDDCFKLLWNWFDTRFHKGATPGFRYNIRRIPGWVSSIVILYAESVYKDTRDQFIAEFTRWCESVLNSTDNRYAVPYEVYRLDIKDVNCSSMTLSAVVLWDVLVDSGLSILCSPDALYLKRDAIYDRCASTHPELLDQYVYYKESDQILSICKLVPQEGGII